MKYKVYQIHLTDAEYDMVNAKGHDSVEKQTLKLDMGFMKSDTKAIAQEAFDNCLLYTSPSPRDKTVSRMPSSA